jgi:transcriptional regulator with XRE-family HTH domain
MAGEPSKGSGRSRPRRIDWPYAARLLAEGLSLGEVAERVGCSKSQLSRKRNRDPEFIGWVDDARGKPPEDRARAQFADLRRAVRRAIEAEVRAGNVRVILWLADRLKLVVAPEERPPERQLDRLLRDLSPAELNEFHALRDPV